MGGHGAEVLVRCTDLVKRFGDRVAVGGVSFAISAGEIYGLLGPNGAGKTTTIRMICGLLRKDAGTVTIDGVAVDETTTVARAKIGYVPQDIALYPDLTARENLRFFGQLYALRGSALEQRIGEVLEIVDLADRADERVEDYSGGMKRRLNIGAGLLHRPVLLVLDEPTVGVDPQSRHAILESVRRLGATGTAVLYTTHYMEEAERLCDRVGIIDRGALIAEGTRRELVALVSGHDRIELAAAGNLDALARAVRGVKGVESADVTDGAVHVLASDGRKLLPALLEVADRNQLAISSVEVVEPDLEAVFLHLTGTALRE
jgi:ABC-2 type transport system ATP-binding protein